MPNARAVHTPVFFFISSFVNQEAELALVTTASAPLYTSIDTLASPMCCRPSST